MLSTMRLLPAVSEPVENYADDGVEVLFLERDRALADMYRLKLQLDGYHVRIAPLENPSRVTRRDPEPDLLFVDVGSGVREGLESLAAWRADAGLRQTPAVIISTVNAARLREEGIVLSPSDELLVIPEPFQHH